jgi:group I intron endonuclease
MEYKNGRIYQIRNTVSDDVYVGSTCQPLSKRMAYHRGNMNSKATLNRPLYVKMKEYGVDCFYIELIEECPCENKEQLRKREGHFIREIATLNMIQAGRTPKEWLQENKERIEDYQHKYHEQNKQQIQMRKKEYREENKDTIAHNLKQYYEAHKEQILENQSILFECSCGGRCRQGDKSRHFRTHKHKNYEATLNV